MNLSTMIKMERIEDVADIRFGLYAQAEDGGSIPYLQLRQFDEDGRQISNSDEFINLEKKNEGHLLKNGEVLFVGKGNRIFSWQYKEDFGPAIASSVFFILSLNQKQIDPGYLVAVLNTPQSKAVFQQIGGGTNIFSIRKSELGAFQIPVPPLQQQKGVAALAQLHQKEIELAQQLIKQKKAFYTAVISKLIK